MDNYKKLIANGMETYQNLTDQKILFTDEYTNFQPTFDFKIYDFLFACNY